LNHDWNAIVAMIESLISIAFCLSTALTVLILLLPSQYKPQHGGPSTESNNQKKPKPTIQILVLGDIGRSPRMQYHALSIAKQGGDVVIIGYKGQYIHDI
jgi:beta-1,4-mannosyltransferase